MSALNVFRYDGADVRTVVIDGEPWFVATDVARVLGYRDAANLTRRLDDDEKGTHSVSTPGGSQDVTIISESGLYVAVMGSQIEGARAFKRWVTHEVIPSIRRTGSYSNVPALSEDEIVHQALAITARRVQALESHVAELTPRAEAWDEIASAEGDYSVADAAAMLNRAGITTGRDRLFQSLADMRWIYRGEKRRWRPYASTIDAGYMTERAQPPHRDADGELVPSPPQVRITLRGVERLRVRMGALA